jgi:DnaJ-domain-containing protein 1
MDASQYYVTTLTNAASKIGPVLGYAIVAYFIFIKLPFLLALKSQKDNRTQNNDDGVSEKSTTPAFQEQVKLEKKSEQKKENSKEEPKQEKQKKEEKKKKTFEKKFPSEESNPYNIFSLNIDQKFTKSELKKKYYDLLRQNHPDKVASLGPEFKKLAEKKTKDINSAYDELKKKAS